MFGFEALPPEINSGLMYTGPGAGPMSAASAAWDMLADDLYLAAAAYGSALTDLTSTWRGPSSLSMAAAGATYVTWISATAAQAEQAAAQAKAAVAAYEAAFTMTVPPAEIAANRALLMALVATNFFGQNTPAIMATEALYVEMWAQDATAMYGYAGASSAASVMTPFTVPKATTNGAGTTAVAQAAGSSAQAVAQVSTTTMPSALQAVGSTATSTTTSPAVLTASTTTTTPSALTAGQSLASGATSSASMLTSAATMLGSSGTLAKSFGATTGVFPMFKSSLSIGTSAVASPGSAVTAVSGRAASLGALSVPQGWTSAAPAFSHVASALPAGSGLPAAPAPLSGSPTGPITPPLAQAAEQGGARTPLATRYNFRPAMVQRPVYAG